MRIAMIGYTLYPDDPRVRRAAEALAESGHEVDVFAVAHERAKASSGPGPLRVHLVRMSRQQSGTARYAFEYGAFFTWAFALVSVLHVRRRYDVVYVHNMPNFLVFAGLLPKICGAKIVLDVHDPAAELLACIRGRNLPPWLRRLANIEERVSMAFSDALVTVNESMRRRLSAMSRLPVAVVMNLPGSALIAPVEASPGGEGPEWLVYSGSIADRNGLDLVVRALWLLAGDFPSLRFRIIGEGPALGPVMKLAQDLGVANRVDYLGFVSHDEVPVLVNGAAAGISPQREGIFGSLVFSMKVAEYVAFGLPVICSGIATMRYYFSDDELLFFEPGSAEDLARAIRRVLTDPAAARERSARSLIKLGKLDWPAQKETLVATVEATAHSKRTRR
jgi:glycosyltransferase involved in cell wall biosynthesis